MRRLMLVMMAALALPLLIQNQTAHAASINVNSAIDSLILPADSSKPCSLREAVQAANLNIAVHGCAAGSPSGTDIINVPVGIYLLSIHGAGEDNNASGDLDISSTGGDLTINGIAGSSGTVINGDGSDRVFDIAPGPTVTINSVLVVNGNPVANGGGILNQGTLNLDQSTVFGNTGLNFGGGIFSTGTMTLTDTTVTANVTNGPSLSGGGGGIYTQGTMTLIRSTVDTNVTQARGGGIYNLDQGTLLVNSTVSGNRALNGGGIFNRFGGVSLEFSTTASNTATSTTGGLWNFGGRLTLHNTIVGNNVGPGVTPSDCNGVIVDFGFNLADDSTCLLSTSGSFNNAVLNLLPLALNPPGSTRTHALGPGSAAIDGADPSLCPPQPSVTNPPTDQRGVVRPQPAGGICDVGAYEVTCSVTIDKLTNPGGGAGFAFGSSFFPGFALDDGQSKTFSGQHLCGPIYNVFETPQPGWVLTNIACVITGGTGNFKIIGANANPGFQAGDSEVNFDSLTPGANLRCTFTNTQPPPPGSITICKETPGHTGVVGPFGFTNDGGSLPPFNLSSNLGNGSCVTFINLTAGTYVFSEASLIFGGSTWQSYEVDCTGGTSTTTTIGSVVTINLAAGQNITCRFLNSFIVGGGIVKSCDPNETATNSGPGPSCNLFICEVGPCAGAGEGDLVVIEHVNNVQTSPNTLGLGAYEFNVEFDSFVIQSVNPTDIIFTAGCPAGPCGTAPSNTNGFAALGRGAPDCTMTILFENSVRFGCVTHGQNPGPLGSFDLAKLDLIPSSDDVKDLFPGNNNGVPTLIKDNQCELADTLGHPVVGSVNGAGLLPKCGDIYVTVRILEGDLNLDCVVNLADEAIIAQHYGAFFGSAFYQKWFDLEPSFHDLDIDIKDLQKVFGREGSTCQNPVPAQTPVPPPFDLNS